MPQDAALFELVAAWAKAPTLSAELTISPDLGLFEALYRQTTPSLTTPAGCY